MGLIDQMKYAKILYLADVLEDIRNEMNRDYRCHSYAESISGIVKDLRETVAVTSMPNEMECEKIKIARLETAYKADMFVPAENREEYEASIRRRGLMGRIKDRILGPVMKPQAVMVLTKKEQELLKEYMENPEKVNAAVNACAVTAEDIKETTDRLVVLARGHHIRNADGTVTDVSNNPNYICND